MKRRSAFFFDELSFWDSTAQRALTLPVCSRVLGSAPAAAD